MMNTEDSGLNVSRKHKQEFSYLIKYLYESFEMLSRWTPEFSAKELLLILALRGNKPYRISDIAHYTGFSVSTVSWLVGRLAKKKIVTRRRHQTDRRVVMVKLASKGKEAIDEFDRIFEEIADTFYSVLTLEEQKDLLRFSEKVISRLEEKGKGNCAAVRRGNIAGNH